jgi:hypothetical protein
MWIVIKIGEGMSNRAELRRKQKEEMKMMLQRTGTSWRTLRKELGAKPISQNRKVNLINSVMTTIKAAKKTEIMAKKYNLDKIIPYKPQEEVNERATEPKITYIDGPSIPNRTTDGSN